MYDFTSLTKTIVSDLFYISGHAVALMIPYKSWENIKWLSQKCLYHHVEYLVRNNTYFDNNHILLIMYHFLLINTTIIQKKCKKYLQNVKFVGIFHFLLSIFIETCLKTYLQLWCCCFFIGANEILNGVCKVVHSFMF